MNNRDKAKQFMPFDALNGFKEEMEKQTLEKESMPLLSEDALEQLNNDLIAISNNYIVRISYFYSIMKEVVGIVKDINYAERYIKIDNNKIFFDTIVKIECLEKR